MEFARKNRQTAVGESLAVSREPSLNATDQQYVGCETPDALERNGRRSGAAFDASGSRMTAHRPSGLTIIVSPSPNQSSASNMNVMPSDRNEDENDDENEVMLGGKVRTKKKKKKRIPAVDMHAFRTCIILGMPWAAYSVFSESCIFPTCSAIPMRASLSHIYAHHGYC